ncbi:hypothetical protein [Limosilactobacillus sp.]|uniref:hypothetical protein n=1 Tax=Limosilactobacillus sp. TaxID=2773925 RepID=UPI00345EAC4F
MGQENQIQPTNSELPELQKHLSADQLNQAKQLATQLADDKANTILNYGKDTQGELLGHE